MAPRTARLLGGLGRTMITLGVLLILFAGYQLWGTGLAEQRAQDDLASSFEQRRDRVEAVGATSTTTDPAPTTTTVPVDPGEEAPTTTAPPPPPTVAPELAQELLPDLGETMGRIVIPSIGVDKYVVEGVRRSDLRQGPGHYPDSPLPGQAGNAAIAGHRTTYGAPFGDLDRLAPGDLITVETLQGTFSYEVMGHPDGDGGTVGHFIVRPSQLEVLDDVGDDRLTLTACHPKYSAAQRIVVTAQLVTPPAATISEPAPAAKPEAEAEPDPEPDPDPDEHPVDEPDDGAEAGGEGGGDLLDESLGWDTSEAPEAIGWGAATAVLAGLVLAAGRRWRRGPAWLLGAPLVLGGLFVTFGHLDRMLPAL